MKMPAQDNGIFKPYAGSDFLSGTTVKYYEFYDDSFNVQSLEYLVRTENLRDKWAKLITKCNVSHGML